MKIIKDNKKIVCDIKGCNNLAKYKLVLDVGAVEYMRICEHCLKSFYKEASEKIREEDERESSKVKKQKVKK